MYPGILSELLGDTETGIQNHFLVTIVSGMLWQQHQHRRRSAVFSEELLQKELSSRWREKDIEINPLIHTYACR